VLNYKQPKDRTQIMKGGKRCGKQA